MPRAGQHPGDRQAGEGEQGAAEGEGAETGGGDKEPGEQSARGAGDRDRRVHGPLHRRAAVERCRLGDQGGAADQAEVPAEAEQDEREGETGGAVRGGESGHASRRQEDRAAGRGHPRRSEPVDEPPGERGRQVHGAHMQGDDQSGGPAAVAVVAHVHRGHGHHRDHDQLGEDHDTGPGGETPVAPGPPTAAQGNPPATQGPQVRLLLHTFAGLRWPSRLFRLPLRTFADLRWQSRLFRLRRRIRIRIRIRAQPRIPRRQLPRPQEGVRAQGEGQGEGGRRIGDGGQEEGAGQAGQAPVHGRVPGGLEEVGAGDRAQSGGEEHGADRPAAPCGRGEVGPRVPGLEGGRGTGAVDQEGAEEQGHAVHGGREHHGEAAEGGHRVSGGEPRSAAPVLAEAPDAQRAEGGAAGEERGGHSGEPGRAQHLVGEQGAHGDPRGHARAAEQLGHREDEQDPALLRRLGGGCRGPWPPTGAGLRHAAVPALPPGLNSPCGDRCSSEASSAPISARESPRFRWRKRTMVQCGSAPSS